MNPVVQFGRSTIFLSAIVIQVASVSIKIDVESANQVKLLVKRMVNPCTALEGKQAQDVADNDAGSLKRKIEENKNFECSEIAIEDLENGKKLQIVKKFMSEKGLIERIIKNNTKAITEILQGSYEYGVTCLIQRGSYMLPQRPKLYIILISLYPPKPQGLQAVMNFEIKKDTNSSSKTNISDPPKLEGPSVILNPNDAKSSAPSKEPLKLVTPPLLNQDVDKSAQSSVGLKVELPTTIDPFSQSSNAPFEKDSPTTQKPSVVLNPNDAKSSAPSKEPSKFATQPLPNQNVNKSPQTEDANKLSASIKINSKHCTITNSVAKPRIADLPKPQQQNFVINHNDANSSAPSTNSSKLTTQPVIIQGEDTSAQSSVGLKAELPTTTGQASQSSTTQLKKGTEAKPKNTANKAANYTVVEEPIHQYDKPKVDIVPVDGQNLAKPTNCEYNSYQANEEFKAAIRRIVSLRGINMKKMSTAQTKKIKEAMDNGEILQQEQFNDFNAVLGFEVVVSEGKKIEHSFLYEYGEAGSPNFCSGDVIKTFKSEVESPLEVCASHIAKYLESKKPKSTIEITFKGKKGMYYGVEAVGMQYEDTKETAYCVLLLKAI